jgi:MFS transporter, FSR family, fosmidomycin resistance protein
VSSIQSVSLIAQFLGEKRSRAALGTYNFAGDLGKMALPAATSGLLALLPWRLTLLIIGITSLAGVAAVLRLPEATRVVASNKSTQVAKTGSEARAPKNRYFLVLLTIGVIDGATRMGFLTFLPFLLRGRGATPPTVGLALVLVFIGGAVGKLVCGLLGARLGVLWTVWLTEGATALGILTLVPLPLTIQLCFLPFIGIALNGTSSVLYGTVPELVVPEGQTRAFGIFYTGTIGAGAISPAIYGLLGDAAGVPAMMYLVAGVVLLTLPLAWLLSAALNPP